MYKRILYFVPPLWEISDIRLVYVMLQVKKMLADFQVPE